MIPSPMNQSSLECLVKNWRYRHRWLRSFHCSPGYIWFPYKGSNHKKRNRWSKNCHQGSVWNMCGGAIWS